MNLDCARVVVLTRIAWRERLALRVRINHLRGTMQMKALPTVIMGSVASVLMLNGFAFGQQQSQQQQQYQQGPTQQLTVREARQFMSGIEQDKPNGADRQSVALTPMDSK